MDCVIKLNILIFLFKKKKFLGDIKSLQSSSPYSKNHIQKYQLVVVVERKWLQPTQLLTYNLFIKHVYIHH